MDASLVAEALSPLIGLLIILAVIKSFGTAWGCGFFVFLAGVGSIISNPLYGIAMAISGLLIMPGTFKIINEKTHGAIENKLIRFIFIIVLIYTSVWLSDILGLMQ